MRASIKVGLAIVAAFGLPASGSIFDFGEPVLDGSSETAYEESMEEMANALSEDQLRALSQAMVVITIDAVVPDGKKHLGLLGAIGTDMDSPMTRALIRKAVDGLTAVEIIAKADEIKVANEDAKAVADAKDAADVAEAAKVAEQEARELREAKTAYARRMAANIMFHTANFRKDTDGFLSGHRVDVQLANRSQQAIAGLTYRAEMRTPGRAVAWREEDREQVWFRGGVEPGETRETTESFSWYDDFPDDAVFTAYPLCVYAPAVGGYHQPMFSPPDEVCGKIRE